MSQAKSYKLVHAGYPDYQQSPMIMGDGGRVKFDDAIDTEIIPAIPKKPVIYFDAARLSKALEQVAFDAQKRVWRLATAMRNVRLADCESEMVIATATLQETYDNIIAEDTNAKVVMLVNDLANQIDIMAPPNPVGYVPHMGLHYAAKPLCKIIETIKGVFQP